MLHINAELPKVSEKPKNMKIKKTLIETQEEFLSQKRNPKTFQYNRDEPEEESVISTAHSLSPCGRKGTRSPVSETAAGTEWVRQPPVLAADLVGRKFKAKSSVTVSVKDGAAFQKRTILNFMQNEETGQTDFRMEMEHLSCAAGKVTSGKGSFIFTGRVVETTGRNPQQQQQQETLKEIDSKTLSLFDLDLGGGAKNSHPAAALLTPPECLLVLACTKETNRVSSAHNGETVWGTAPDCLSTCPVELFGIFHLEGNSLHIRRLETSRHECEETSGVIASVCESACFSGFPQNLQEA
uniref:Uncharacterized protein n=1 Tax=Chromera velia CCMP2878 TaxID=1169474 RepID=A0A0G4GPZ4_9ALVE|mmetsp:Transcript_28443/g.55698  ORF Transcript_28443/g.55698 Transcript_28443/m.55698 type:complete len:297 (+) Transcript_28443:412-1302(+)|eukprot:Cvel_22877.t1-p1 / transcript=Cvel_22877.t1 / gene=Cvel_22877 / organism=Chromera_velia_CCMP2878 / gene_product=hypothetical protein / transcript_product=hypothetical protein / location=Cvel_scaffold2297:21597-22484(-) / protein_length=296 / sequence_SO=supercontig / SO=protein_coding / is_pseudo=false